MSLLRRFSLLAIAACVVAVTCFAVPRVEAGSALSRLSSKLDGSYSPQPIRSRPSDRARTPSSRRASTNDRHVDPTPHNEGLVLKGFGVPRVEIIFDELLYAYKQLKPELTIQFEPTDELDVIDGFLYRSLYDYVLTDDRLDVASLPQRENLAIFPILIEPLVAAYHLVGDILVGDVSPDKCGPVHLSRYVVAAIYNLNITNWRDYRILQLQSPEVAAAMPNEPIRVVVQGSPNNDLRWMQDTLKQWGGPELAASGGWIYGPGFATINDPETEDTFGWSPEYLAQPNVVNVPFEFNIVQGIAVNKYSFALAEFSLVITEGFTQYAEFDNNLGQNLSSVSLIGAVPPTDALDPEAYFDGLRNATGDGVWPVGVPIFVMMRIANFSRELTCLERREMWLFWRWLLHSDIAQERLLLEGYVAMGDETLKVILDYISSIPCVENGTQGAVFLRELPIPQHQGNGFKTILGFNVTFLIISVFLVAGYIYTIKNKLSVPMINILIYFGTLLTGSVLNYVAVIYFYEVPSTSQICQNRVWLACLGFTMLLSAFFSRGYQIFAVHRMETSGIAMLQGVSHNAIQTSINAFAVSVQLVLLIIWTKVDPFEPIKTQIDDLNLTFSYLCASKHTWVWWGLEIAYALVLEGFGLLVVYRTWNLRRTVKESKWVSIAIYNFLVVLTLLVALFASMAVTDDVVLLLGGIATTCLSFVTMSSLFLPRLLRLHALAQKDTDSDDVSDKRGSQLSNLSTGAAAASTNTRRTPGSARSSEDHGSRFLPSIPSTRVATPKGPSPSQSTVDIPSSPLNTYQPSPRPTHHTLPSIPSRSAAEAEELVEAAQQQQQSEPSSPSLGPDMQSLGPYMHQTAVLIANFGSESNLNNSTHSDH